jgi:two-component sensor histidine kinase
VVLTELLQNAVDHGFPEGSTGGSVVVQLSNADGQLHLSVVDNGRGVESGFRLEDATGLGLSIVRTLVTTELDGRISMRPLTADEATRVGLEVAGTVRGTVVELVVPIGEDVTA